jgi:hypothetical protein
MLLGFWLTYFIEKTQQGKLPDARPWHHPHPLVPHADCATLAYPYQKKATAQDGWQDFIFVAAINDFYHIKPAALPHAR